MLEIIENEPNLSSLNLSNLQGDCAMREWLDKSREEFARNDDIHKHLLAVESLLFDASSALIAMLAVEFQENIYFKKLFELFGHTMKFLFIFNNQKNLTQRFYISKKPLFPKISSVASAVFSVFRLFPYFQSFNKGISGRW